ncbi:UDP-N-acetylmuramoyl-L-alanyl-D-glutamate--2,6-diaminopimelate ligase [Parasedimentitalea maritima]|uniref:UDP-N-acetylmuramoyl-L-alanyl-D-glutamate--2,6-diaminopimelate ligase n=1 Tax=Parasedimentitalea maritima TaxID=2578117 RepID=A0ABY2UY90_9RHOB|nr:UDP-N-acetylmuramoyl-L-alanyl-D-glutamate--2,6-diaminopimelate ligase [Zongyanglinia marina]TLP67840.1 UDP-N-acetylmuramoyl-L-alanyl-D-glutamate--2,6-diaminopimelate ligase [Zongyanglinia marina]
MSRNSEKTLGQLGLTARGGADPVITGVTVDSRAVQEGYLFAALPGSVVHGAKFIAGAVDRGAVAILTDTDGAKIAEATLQNSSIALIVVEDPRQTLAYAAALWFGAQPQTIVAVTGTNGKTSVASFVRQIWEELGHAAVNLGTTGVEGAWSFPLAHTTPDPVTLHDALSQAVGHGVTHVAMEASSHGLDQRRLDGVSLAAAGFTNFSQDHLDYHHTFEAYFAAKAGLFRRVLADDGVAVINVDDPRGAEMRAVAGARGQEVITVGRGLGDLSLMGQRFDASGQDMRFSWHDKPYQARLSLIGGFQAENILLACGLVIASGEMPERVFETLPHLKTVRGRMQLAATRGNGAAVFVDFAHTPDAIATALKALRPHVLGRLIAIVGAGGDRDATKRPLMGQAAAENADVVIVTDDNPRSEDPAEIRAAVKGGALEAIEVGDRAEAILRGVDVLAPGDALLICGKGHESGQIVGDDILPFDDVEQASMAVAALDGGLV